MLTGGGYVWRDYLPPFKKKHQNLFLKKIEFGIRFAISIDVFEKQSLI